jgi:hypothetical protein
VLSNPGLEIVMRNPFPDLMKRKVVQWSLAYGAVAGRGRGRRDATSCPRE